MYVCIYLGEITDFYGFLFFSFIFIPNLISSIYLMHSFIAYQ